MNTKFEVQLLNERIALLRKVAYSRGRTIGHALDHIADYKAYMEEKKRLEPEKFRLWQCPKIVDRLEDMLKMNQTKMAVLLAKIEENENKRMLGDLPENQGKLGVD